MVKLKKLILPLFIIGLMVISVLGYAIVGLSGDNKNEVEYKTLKFSQVGNEWVAYKNDQRISTYFNPEELKDLELGNSLIPNLQSSSRIYLNIDPDDGLTQSTSYLGAVFKSILGKQVMPSCREDKEGCEELPLKSCKDSKEGIVILDIYKLELNSIEFNECVRITGNDEYILKLAEKIKLELLV